MNNVKGPGGSTPSQYSLPVGAKELQDLIEHKQMNFAIGNIFKAVYRMGSCSHSDKEYDLNKIIWFANRELEKIKKERYYKDKVNQDNNKYYRDLVEKNERLLDEFLITTGIILS